jgi:hypothetical protein
MFLLSKIREYRSAAREFSTQITLPEMQKDTAEKLLRLNNGLIKTIILLTKKLYLKEKRWEVCTGFTLASCREHGN